MPLLARPPLCFPLPILLAFVARLFCVLRFALRCWTPCFIRTIWFDRFCPPILSVLLSAGDYDSSGQFYLFRLCLFLATSHFHRRQSNKLHNFRTAGDKRRAKAEPHERNDSFFEFLLLHDDVGFRSCHSAGIASQSGI